MAERGKKARGRPAGVDEELGRAFGAATAQYGQAMAERLGLGVTDQKCLELVQREDLTTPGLLAERTGLTSGAITAVLDRLEKAGFVRREKDPADRRQVVVRLTPERAPELQALFEPLRRGWYELCARLGDRERTAVAAFLQQATGLLQKEASELRGPSAPAASEGEARPLSAPRGGVAKGRLEILRGASRVRISAGPPELLYRVRSESPPKVTVQGGRVRVEAVRSLMRMFSRKALHIELCPEIPWELALRGGLSDVQADLRGLRLAGFEAAGGAHDVLVQLPAPAGTVPVRVDGGAHKLRVERPARAPVRVLVDGGANGLVLDLLQLGAVSGDTRWESPEYAAARDRHDLAIRGGANDLKIVAV